MKNKYLVQVPAICALALSSSALFAAELVKNDSVTLNSEGEAILGAFSSGESYAPFAAPGRTTWAEGYFSYGLNGEYALGNGALYGKASAIASFTAGDGDAAGLTTGDESRISKEDVFFGYKNSFIDVSIGSQGYTIGDGFILSGDALNFGEGFDVTGVDFDRGGAYWLAARKAFNLAAVIKVGGETGPRAELFALGSDNPGQASMELTGVNLEYVHDVGTVGFTVFSGTNVDATEAEILGLAGRDGQTTTSVRFQGNAGVENLFLSAEYVDQSQGSAGGEDANAGYVEAAWTFANTSWAPTLGYRFSSYDEGYDALFNGFTRGYGTWFQGEVAGNFAGPFNTNTDTQHLSVKATPSELLTLGASLFSFNPKEGDDLKATEFNLWAEYVTLPSFLNGPLIISPLLALFDPENSVDEGGSQLDNSDTNVYFQVLAIVPF